LVFINKIEGVTSREEKEAKACRRREEGWGRKR